MPNAMELDTDLLALLPPWYREVLDYQQIAQTEKAQFGLLAAEIVAVADNFFFQTMDAASVAQWEQIFGILPDPATESLAFRRSRVLSRASTRPPFTMGFLRLKLDELIGPGQWTIEMDYANYTLYIESAAYNQNYATEIAYTIGQIKPAHIVYINRPYTVAALDLSETISLDKRVYQYRLGSWGLGMGAFANNFSMGVIKTAATPSIQDLLLSGVANYVSGDIVSVRLNGSVTISNITKTVEGNTLTLTYTVMPADTSAITQIDLLDADGGVLTSTTIYVPVTDVTIMKHVIPVREGEEGGNLNG